MTTGLTVVTFMADGLRGEASHQTAARHWIKVLTGLAKGLETSLIRFLPKSGHSSRAVNCFGCTSRY